MSRLLIEECEKFALYIANEDANTWNGLCRELTVLYKENDEEVFDFLALDCCYKVANEMLGNYFHRFCQDELKALFYRHSRGVIAHAAAEILFRIKRELEIGNYYE